MSFVFISHASKDKVALVRPVVEALVDEGVRVWIDRPGAGEDNFGFEQDYIEKNNIDFLLSGNSWSKNIEDALAQSGAVLGCLSRSLKGQRDVIQHELLVAQTHKKLVTCILDDLHFSELPDLSRGLLDLSGVQSPKLNPGHLRKALEARRQTGCEVEQLPPALLEEWEKLRNLIGTINKKIVVPDLLRQKDIDRIVPILRRVPIGPVLKITSIPDSILRAVANNLDQPDRMRAALDQANTLVVSATEDRELAEKMTIRAASLPPLGSTTPDFFWTQALAQSGLRARRTVAALLMSPVAQWALKRTEAHSITDEFLNGLEAGTVV